MISSGHNTNSKTPVRQPVLLGLFTGAAVGLGYLLAGVPNVELMTLVIALAGAVIGPGRGLVAGAMAAVVFSLGSPYGLPVPLMLAAQAVGLGAAGVFGAIGGNRVLACCYKGSYAAAMSWAAATGLGSTLIYDLLTNLAIIGAFDMNAAVVLTGAVPFALIHLASNAVIFAALLPPLLPRLAGLNRSALVGRTGPPLLLLVLVAAAASPVQASVGAAPDSTLNNAAAAAAVDSAVAGVVVPGAAVPDSLAGDKARRPVPPAAALSGPAAAHGWQRALWTPFARTALEWLHWYSTRVPVVDGGLGAPSVVLGEAGTSWNPLFFRDGIPLGTGHVLTDDAALVPTEGLRFDTIAYGDDGWGGTGGQVASRTADSAPASAESAYRGVKGPHETYFRAVHVLTPEAAWRAGFEFEESLDIEGYNPTTAADADFVAASGIAFPGHARVRQSRTRLFRRLDQENNLVLEYTNGRLTKDYLPAYGAEHLELWDDGIAATMHAGLGTWHLDSSLFWRSRDAVWGIRGDNTVIGEDQRLLETGREGLSLDLHRGAAGADVSSGIAVRVTRWQVDDSLSNDPWLASFSGDPAGTGQTIGLTGRTGFGLGPTVLTAAAGADWHSWSGTTPVLRGEWRARGPRPWWTVNAAWGGRAPRSDELLTPLRRNVAGRGLVLLPNGDLHREKTMRLGLILQARLLGLDLALDGSTTRLRDGITWQPLPGESDSGRWANDLALDSRRVTATVGREGRFLGWGRVLLEGTWQTSDEIEGRASVLPPEQYLQSRLMWENHFFQEDGILQLALFSTLQGEMADPWDVTRTAQLPSRTVHDLLVGFRLVGANLSLAFRNLTGERTRLTSGALSTGQEMDLRLHWAWLY